MKINSVLGPVDTRELGITLMHEHVLCANWTARANYPDWLERKEFIDLAVKMLKRAKQFGVKTMIDGTPPGLGRDISVLREVSEKAEINIIASTGFYWYEEAWLVGKDRGRMVERLVREVEEGIQGTDSKAGIIKCATDYKGMTAENQHLLEIVADTQKITGLPIFAHGTVQNKVAAFQQQFFADRGVPAEKIILGHLGDTDNVEYIESILKKGSYAGLDRFGLEWIFPDEKRIATLKKLIEDGWADKLFLSHDFSVFIDEINNEWSERKNVDVEHLNFQYTHIFERVLPELLEQGVEKEVVNRILSINPQNFFESDGRE